MDAEHLEAESAQAVGSEVDALSKIKEAIEIREQWPTKYHYPPDPQLTDHYHRKWFLKWAADKYHAAPHQQQPSLGTTLAWYTVTLSGKWDTRIQKKGCVPLITRVAQIALEKLRQEFLARRKAEAENLTLERAAGKHRILTTAQQSLLGDLHNSTLREVTIEVTRKCGWSCTRYRNEPCAERDARIASILAERGYKADDMDTDASEDEPHMEEETTAAEEETDESDEGEPGRTEERPVAWSCR